MLEKLIGNVKGFFNRITIIELIISLVYVVCGILFFANPTASNILVAILLGIIFITNGLLLIYSYIKREKILLFNNNLLYGAILILVGIIIMFTSNILNIMISIFLIVLGAQKINYGLVLKRFNESSWLITLVTGVLFIIIALVTLIIKSDSLVKAAGIMILGYALINIVNVILLRKRSRYYLD